MALSDIVPINRKEEFLQAIADKSGAPSPVTRIEEFLKRISESSGLPEVTSDDNGDFLGVVDGEWDKVPAPSSLPPYTAADIGKVPTVVEESNVIVPETTLTSEDFEYYEPLDAYLYKYSGQLVNGRNYALHLTISGETDDYIGLAISQDDAIIFAPEDDEPPFQIIYSPSTFGEYIVFVADENLPAGMSVTISFEILSADISWEEKIPAARVETIYNSNGIEVAFATYHDDIVTISAYGSGITSSYLTGATFPKVSPEYENGLGVARAYTAVYDPSTGNYKGCMFIDKQGLASFLGTVTGSIIFTNFSYKYAP